SRSRDDQAVCSHLAHVLAVHRHIQFEHPRELAARNDDIVERVPRCWRDSLALDVPFEQQARFRPGAAFEYGSQCIGEFGASHLSEKSEMSEVDAKDRYWRARVNARACGRE